MNVTIILNLCGFIDVFAFISLVVYVKNMETGADDKKI